MECNMQVRRHVTTLLCQILGARDAMQATSVCSVTADKELTGNKQLSKRCIATHTAELIKAALLLTMLKVLVKVAERAATGLLTSTSCCRLGKLIRLSSSFTVAILLAVRSNLCRRADQRHECVQITTIVMIRMTVILNDANLYISHLRTSQVHAMQDKSLSS